MGVTLPFKHNMKQVWFLDTKVYLWSATFTAVATRERLRKNVSTDLNIQREIAMGDGECKQELSLFFLLTQPI